MIWNKVWTLEELNKLNKNTMGEALGIEFINIGVDSLTAKMPVNNNTKQPAGLLHGGASVALAETLGSIAALMSLPDFKTHLPVGLEINANHIRSQTSGYVTGVATPLHLGKSTHVWEIKIINEEQKLCCVSRLTVAIIARTSK